MNDPEKSEGQPQVGSTAVLAPERALCSECGKRPQEHYDLCACCANDWSDDDREDLTCPRCCGTGGEPMDDGITPCEYCDGEGYEYWR